MIPLWALGLGKSLLVDAPNQQADAQLQATTAALSPWTGLKPSSVQKADPFGATLGGYIAQEAQDQGDARNARQETRLDEQLQIERERMKAEQARLAQLESAGMGAQPQRMPAMQSAAPSAWSGYSLGNYRF